MGFDLVQVEAHLLTLLHELLFLLAKVAWNLASAHLSTRAHRHLLLDAASLLLTSWVGVNVMLAHPVEQLRGYLHERLLSKHVRVVLEIVVGHELNDIGGHVLTERLRVECLLIAVELLHGAEIGIADANDDDGEGKLRSFDDLVNRLVHVIDDTVGDDDQDVELLSGLALQVRHDMVVDLSEDFAEVSRSVEAALLQSILIALDHTLNPGNAGIEDISVQGEAVRRTVGVGRDCATEAVEVDHLVSVIELENVAHILDSLQILVALRVEIVKRGWLARVAIGQGEVDGDRKVDFATAKDVFEERVLAIDLQVSHVESALLFLHLKVGGS